VSDDQLSLAIGRRGQNVKLASKLTGWKIDVRSESVAEEESKRARSSLESIPDIGIGESELLYQEGYRSLREVSIASLEDLMSIEGLDSERASSIHQAAIKLNSEQETAAEEDEDRITDIDQLILPDEIREQLFSSGFDSIQSLAMVNEQELCAVTGLASDEANQVCKAIETFLRVQTPMNALREQRE